MRAVLRRLYHNDIGMEKLYRRAYVVADVRADPVPTIGWVTQTQAGRRAVTGTTLGLVPGYDDPLVAYDDPAVGYDTGGVQTYVVPVGGRGVSIDIEVEDVGEAATVVSAVTVEATALGIRPLYRTPLPPSIPQPALPVARMQLAVEIGGDVPETPVESVAVAMVLSTPIGDGGTMLDGAPILPAFG